MGGGKGVASGPTRRLAKKKHDLVDTPVHEGKSLPGRAASRNKVKIQTAFRRARSLLVVHPGHGVSPVTFLVAVGTDGLPLSPGVGWIQYVQRLG